MNQEWGMYGPRNRAYCPPTRPAQSRPVHDAAGDHPAQAHCTNSVPPRMYIRNGLATPPGHTTVQTGCAYAGGEARIPQYGGTCAVKRLQGKLQRAACHTIQIRATCSDATLFPPKTFFARPVMATAPCAQQPHRLCLRLMALLVRFNPFADHERVRAHYSRLTAPLFLEHFTFEKV